LGSRENTAADSLTWWVWGKDDAWMLEFQCEVNWMFHTVVNAASTQAANGFGSLPIHCKWRGRTVDTVGSLQETDGSGTNPTIPQQTYVAKKRQRLQKVDGLRQEKTAQSLESEKNIRAEVTWPTWVSPSVFRGIHSPFEDLSDNKLVHCLLIKIAKNRIQPFLGDYFWVTL
jgi:hypothetical protein